MFLFEWFRSFLPLRNPIGFGAADFIELAAAVLLVVLLLARARVARWFAIVAEKTGWCMLLLAALTVLLRLAMLAQSPVPTPSGADDFSHLLAGDTLRHLRLANPTHPMHRFFESVFTLQEPSYSSIFPIGQGLILAFGWIFFGHPWVGVVLSVAAFPALCYWMLRAWTTPAWALAGGLLAAIEFGPLRYWMNTYWGGAVSAVAGCLIFGALPRLRDRGRTRDAVLLGAGAGLQFLARPFEALLLTLPIALFCLPDLRRMRRALGIAVLVALPAAGLALLQNRMVTGSWTTMPYELSRYQYGVPTTFTTQPVPIPHRELTQQQRLDYDAQAAVHGVVPESVTAYLVRLAGRVRFYRFFFFVPLYLALPLFVPAMRERRFLWIGFTIAVMALGTNFYPYFYPHYIAAITCLLVLACVIGLERLSRLTIRGRPVGVQLAGAILVLCAAHFLFWYGLRVAGAEAVAAYDTWDFVNFGDPEGRIAVNRRLTEAPGSQLVFVRYWPAHQFDEWVQNAAEIDRARVVWALDLGAAENEKLRQYYPDRTAWLLEPDAKPPRLAPYENAAK
jgi:hypothetical protein